MALVDNIRNACAEQRISIHELERKAGLTQNSVYKWDKHVPRVDSVAKVAGILHTSVEKLLK